MFGIHICNELTAIHRTQLAFVLNQNQHWYTLRRFGGLEGNSHWFNLDSCKPSPQWVSKTYLGMFLQQAETDGQSTTSAWIPVILINYRLFHIRSIAH